jgi:hypothetical protein
VWVCKSYEYAGKRDNLGIGVGINKPLVLAKVLRWAITIAIDACTAMHRPCTGHARLVSLLVYPPPPSQALQMQTRLLYLVPFRVLVLSIAHFIFSPCTYLYFHR